MGVGLSYKKSHYKQFGDYTMKAEPIDVVSGLFYEYAPGNGAVVGIEGQTAFDPLKRRFLISDGKTPGGVVMDYSETEIDIQSITKVVPLSIIQSKALSYFKLLQEDLNQLMRSGEFVGHHIQAYVGKQYKNLIRFLNEEVIDAEGCIHWEMLKAIEDDGFQIWFNNQQQVFQMRINGITLSFFR